MIDFIDLPELKGGGFSSYVMVFISIISIFLPIFYVLILSLINIAEDAKGTALKKKKKGWDKYYEKIDKFTSISAEYFHLMAVYLIIQVLKYVFSRQSGFYKEIYLISSFIYLCYIALYFAINNSKEKSSNGNFIILLFLFYILPIIIWTIFNKLNKYDNDIFCSFYLLLIILGIWFGYYPLIYSPFSNIKKLKKISNA